MAGVALALGYYANFEMAFSGTANGHKNCEHYETCLCYISLEKKFNAD